LNLARHVGEDERSEFFSNFWNIKPIEKAYERLNYALKERSEHVFSTKAK
jgi:hypothetical protein